MPKDLIVADPTVMLGKPIIAGTRITVELILEKLGAGQSVDELLEGYPQLSPESIQAALNFAAEAVRLTTVAPLVETHQ